MENQPERRYGRREFLKLVAGLGASILGIQMGCRWGGLPSDPAEGSSNRTSTPEREPVVAISRGDDPAAMVRRAVELAGGLGRVVMPGTTVFVKPNLTIPSASGLGNVTDPRVIRAVIELCKEAGASRILVGDGSGGGETDQIMRQAGYEQVLSQTGATFVDLNRDEVVTRRVTDPIALPEYSVARTPVEAPVLISVAVLKVHNSAIVTLSAKNLMGITARQVYSSPRQKLHDAGVQKVTADVVRIRKPDFAIIDGIVGLEGDSPLHGTPVPMNLVIAGRNPVSVDAVGAAVMGFDPQTIDHLTLMTAKGVGESDLSKIIVKGSSIADVQRRFRRK